MALSDRNPMPPRKPLGRGCLLSILVLIGTFTLGIAITAALARLRAPPVGEHEEFAEPFTASVYLLIGGGISLAVALVVSALVACYLTQDGQPTDIDREGEFES